MRHAADITRSTDTDVPVAVDQGLLDTVAERVEAEYGIRVVDGRRRRLHAALSGRLAALEGIDGAAYLRRLGPDSDEWRFLLPSVCVGESCFFRDARRWRALADHIMPRLFAAAGDAPVQIRSVGCAAGHEPYSIAAVCESLRGRFPGVRTEIIGHDINHDALAEARTGQYGRYSLRNMTSADRSRLLEPRGDGFRVREPIRRRVRFVYRNLVAWARQADPAPEADLILCQNVVIYFRDALTLKVVEALGRSLKPGGYLVMGHSEVMSPPAGLQMEVVGDSYCFRKPPARTEPAHDPARAAYCHDREWLDGAWALAVREDFAGAEQILSAAEFCLSARLLKAWIGYCRGDRATASRLARRCLAEQPEYSEAHYVLGLVAEAEQDLATALNRFQQAVFTDPTFAVAQFHLADVTRRTAGNRAANVIWRHAEQAAMNDRTRIFRFFGGFDVRAFMQVCRSRRLEG